MDRLLAASRGIEWRLEDWAGIEEKPSRTYLVGCGLIGEACRGFGRSETRILARFGPIPLGDLGLRTCPSRFNALSAEPK